VAEVPADPADSDWMTSPPPEQCVGLDRANAARPAAAFDLIQELRRYVNAQERRALRVTAERDRLAAQLAAVRDACWPLANYLENELGVADCGGHAGITWDENTHLGELSETAYLALLAASPSTPEGDQLAAVRGLVEHARKVSPSDRMTVMVGDLEQALGLRADRARTKAGINDPPVAG
jgi:hypothetical protein